MIEISIGIRHCKTNCRIYNLRLDKIDLLVYVNGVSLMYQGSSLLKWLLLIISINQESDRRIYQLTFTRQTCVNKHSFVPFLELDADSHSSLI
jgi:hypothetical protein